ncbi:MAG TPA: RelA/SpoT family protein [Candidatus Paceibacterota bacterium]|jgi:GTP pyrophosphokinase|nr:RelA/SpoT family protein [Candidatus Paceibacterota bacterium]
MEVSEIIELIKSPSPEDVALIQKAYGFAKEAHKDQKRFSGDPYFSHLFETAKILAELGMSPTTIAAGLLHDSVEDVGVTRETLQAEFGDEILFLVEGVTKLGQIRYHGSNWHTESLRKLFVAMSQDIRVLMVKLADRLHNMRTLSSVPQEKQKRIAAETLEVYAPIADRLGIGRLHRELEDLAFPFVFPEHYAKTRELVARRQEEMNADLEKFHTSLEKVFSDAGFPQAKTSYRVKGLYSLYKKLARNNMDIEKVYDLMALRVIVDTVADCYQALGIVHANWRPLPGRIKDFIAFPKTNGYKSLHTTVFTGDGGIVEVQIRTADMHREAEYGIASHLSYKQGAAKGSAAHPALEWVKGLIPSRKVGGLGAASAHLSYSDVPEWIKELVEYQKSQGDQEFEEGLKEDFFRERIFVFTPVGDVVDLPIDSTPVDFAYAVHSDIGNHMSGAKVNGKLVSLDTALRNADIVEIQTKKNAKPNRKWIDSAKTSMAKKHIRQALEKIERQ